MFVCPEFGQLVCQGRPGTRRQEVRGLINSITPSDEQQDGMRPDGLAWVSCYYYSLPQSLLCPEEPLFASRCCCLLLPLLAASAVTADAAVAAPSPTPTTCTASTSTQPDHTSKLPGTAAQRAIQLSPHIVLRLGRAWLARHPSPVAVLACCRKRRARLACRGLQAATSRPVKTGGDRVTNEAAITPASANFNSATA